MSKKLKPCPFCGSKNVRVTPTIVGIYMAKCYKCGAIVSFNGSEAEERTIKRWNKRVGENNGTGNGNNM